MCADFDEGVVVGAGVSDGLLEADGVAHVGGPVFGVEDRVGVEVFVGGGDDRDRRGARCQVGQLGAHGGLQGVHGRVVRGHFDIDPAGEPVLSTYPFDEGVDLVGGPRDHGLARRVVDTQRDLGVIGDQRLGGGHIKFQQGHAALPGQRGHQPRAGRGHPQSLGRGQRAGHHRGGDLAHGMPDHQIRGHPVGGPQFGQRQLHADQAELDVFDALEVFAGGDHLVQGKPGLGNESGLEFGDRAGKGGFIDQQSLAHAGPLRAAPGIDEHRARPAGTLVRAHHAGPVLAGGHGAQAFDGAVTIARDHGGELGLPGPVMVDGVGHLGQPHLRPSTLHPIGQHRRRHRHPRRRLARHHQRRHSRVGNGPAWGRDLLTLLDHDVRVGAAESERRHPRPARTCRVGPGGLRVNNFHPQIAEGYVRVRTFEALIGRDLAAFNRHHGLDEARDSGCRLGVTQVRLQGADQQRRIFGTASTQHRAQGARLDRVAQQRSGAVRFDIVDHAGLHSRVGVGGPQHRHLGCGVGSHQPVGAAVLVDRRTADHRQHPIAVALRVGQPLEHHHAGALTTDEPVRRGIERAAPTRGR